LSILEFAKNLALGFGGLVAIAYYLTHIAESGINNEAKSKFINIVKNLKATPTIRHAFITFSMLSDYIFGTRLISLRSIAFSFLMSFFWIMVVAIFCIAMFPTYAVWIERMSVSTIIIHNAVLILLAVLIVDFISLCVTRLLLRALKIRSFLGLVTILLFDFTASVGIFYFGITAVKYMIVNPIWISLSDSIQYWYKFDGIPSAFKTLNDLSADMLVKKSDGTFEITGGLNTEIVYAFPEAIAFYSSLLSSIWLWLHVISYATYKAALKTDSLKNSLMKIVNINEKPFSGLAVIVAIMYIPISIVLIAIFSIWKFLI